MRGREEARREERIEIEGESEAREGKGGRMDNGRLDRTQNEVKRDKRRDDGRYKQIKK